MPAAGSPELKRGNGYPEETAYPSRIIAHQAAAMITSIIEALTTHGQLRYAPAFIVYSLFSALIMHVYQTRSSNPHIVDMTRKRLSVCMNALKDISKVWLVAKMVHTLFESILGNKHLEERLQKAAGKRHAKAKTNASAPNVQPKQDPLHQAPPLKRKYDDLDMEYAGGPPAAQMSYERSRPVSPVANVTPSRETQPPPPPPIPNMTAASPPARHVHDAFMGNSRSGTRANTPFMPYSMPGTPPDLFLHTRNTPNISLDLWQNYQPDQLFPPDASFFSLSSPQQTMVDPALRNSANQPQFAPQANMQPPSMPPVHQNPSLRSPHSDAMQAANGLQAMQYSHDPAAWAQLQAMEQQQHRVGSGAGDMGGLQPLPDDAWSNSSTGNGPIVPTTLNVGDWFDFFGIPNNGEMNGLHQY
ncbi:hypothetical protein MBLNU457_3479t2 [Dothideomycetes sp. NU457]